MNLKLFSEQLKKEKSVALFCHMRPDGDTIGSAVALKLGLEKIGISASVFCSDEIPERFLFLPETNKISNKVCGQFSAYLAIDNAEITRLGDFCEFFSAQKNTYSVDHHISNRGFAKYNYLCDKSSNCENVLDLLDALGVSLDEDIASLLLTGIVTDTGNFKHKNVTSETLSYASRLLTFGADLNKIVFNMFTAQSKARAKLFGIVMSKLRYFMDDKIAICSVFLSDLASTGAKADETEGFIDFVMGIDTVEVGACVMQIAENKYKISLRSKKADVNAVASSFGGGGHVLASGCQIFGEYEEVIDKLVFAISRYVEE